MSFQIVCDNCGVTQRVDGSLKWPKPDNWEAIPMSGRDGFTKHLCPDCVVARDNARWSAQHLIQQAQDEALAARRVRT